MTRELPSDPESLKQLYEDRYAGDYMDTDGYGVWAREDFGRLKVRETLQQIPIRPTRILDYGCGQGGWIDTLSTLFPDADVSGVDVSDTAVAKASKKYPRSAFAAFDGNRAPFPDASFDLIFSYHVLEHVFDIEASIRDMSRLLVEGGAACVIFPCGNADSFEEKVVRRLRGGVVPSPDGRTVWFHEVQFGHRRRMTSAETIAIFERNGFRLVCDWYAPIFFGSVDFFCRRPGPAYINQLFRGRAPVSRASGLWLRTTHKALLLLHRLLQRRSVDTSKKRNPLKQSAVRLIKRLAILTDKIIVKLARWEWRTQRERKSGSAQYLVFLRL